MEHVHLFLSESESGQSIRFPDGHCERVPIHPRPPMQLSPGQYVLWIPQGNYLKPIAFIVKPPYPPQRH